MIHLTPEQLLDVADGTRPDRDFPHLEGCAACAGQLAELRGTIETVSAVGVPEPSPLFWNHLSDRVRSAISDDRRPSPWPAFLSSGWWRFAAAAAVIAAMVLVVAPALRRSPAPVVNDPLQADAVPAFDEDPALALLADLSAEMDWEAAAEAGLMPADGAVDNVVLSLSAEERSELHRILQEALAASGA